MDTYYTECLAWYRKLLEHLYYIILLEEDFAWDEKFKLYILYREYDYHRRILKSHKENFDIPHEKNIYFNDFNTVSDNIIQIQNWDNMIPDILRTKNNRRINIGDNPFYSLERIHETAFEKSNYKEKKYIWSLSSELVYWLLSNSVHSNPTDFHKLRDTESINIFIEEVFSWIIQCVMNRYTRNFTAEDKPDEQFKTLFWHNRWKWDIMERRYDGQIITFHISKLEEKHEEKVIHLKRKNHDDEFIIPATFLN